MSTASPHSGTNGTGRTTPTTRPRRVATVVDHEPHSHEEHEHEAVHFEGLDYDTNENMVWKEHNLARSDADLRWETMYMWFVSFAIGCLTALIAFLIDVVIRALAAWKFNTTNAYIIHSNYSSFWGPFLVHAGISVFLVSISGFLVAFLEPVASGSGIPEIKCYLNGVKVPRVVRIKTLIAKAVGVMFSVSGGMPVGKEGPMIHSGAVVAAGVSQGKSTSMPLDAGVFTYFRNDHAKRDFVAGGAAAGVSAAFGAPIGGVLFSLEEGASHWNQQLTWRTFFCSMTSSFVLNILLSGTIAGSGWGQLSRPGLVNFGVFSDTKYTVVDFPFFIAIGVIGGLLGALFNFINGQLTVFRMKHISDKHRLRRFLEVVFLALLIACLTFIWAYFFSTCLPINQHTNGGMVATRSQVVRFYCPKGYYNDMATIIFTQQEEAIKQLFHNEDEFSATALILFVLVYFFMACSVYGIAIPSGLFIPCLLCGSAYGRLIGALLKGVIPGVAVNPGAYSLIGASSMLGGVVRMTISLTVIIIESTNDIAYAPAIMITIMVSKWVGDVFNEGLYDIHIELKHVPFLGWEPDHIMSTLTAADVMAQPVVVVPKKVRVYDIVRLLHTCQHNGFPVAQPSVYSSREKFAGLILRHEIVTLLRERAFHSEEASDVIDGMFLAETDGYAHVYGVSLSSDTTIDDTNSMNVGDKRATLASVRLVDHQKFVEAYPRYPTIDDVEISQADMQKFINLTPYMNPYPFTILPIAPLSRVFRLFRTMGIRHLPVVDKDRNIVGMITRANLVHLEEKLDSLMRRTQVMEGPGRSISRLRFRSNTPSERTPLNEMANEARVRRDRKYHSVAGGDSV